jgi:mRNA-degrading endonuclease toxin of MazEF toxin-antitoxin module
MPLSRLIRGALCNPFRRQLVVDGNGCGDAQGVILEQVKSIDFRARKAKRIGRASDGVLEEVLSILDACVY